MTEQSERPWWKDRRCILGAITVPIIFLSGISSCNTFEPRPPPPDPSHTPSPMALIDEILKSMGTGSVAFNSPAELEINESAVIQLRLSTQKPAGELQSEITAAGKIIGAKIRVNREMEARLSGTGFRIEAITPEIQAISDIEVTEWKWEIEATKLGIQRLNLTLSALLNIDGARTPRVIRTFERNIDVKVTLGTRVSQFVGNNWQWLFAVIFIPLIVWLVGEGSRRRGSGPPSNHGQEKADAS